MKPKVAVVLEGGFVSAVISSTNMDVIVIDHDIEGANATSTVEGIDTQVCLSAFDNPEVNPEFFKQFQAENEEPVLIHNQETDYTMPPNMKSCWITVDGISLYVARELNGAVKVAAYYLDRESEEAIEEMAVRP